MLDYMNNLIIVIIIYIILIGGFLITQPDFMYDKLNDKFKDWGFDTENGQTPFNIWAVSIGLSIIIFVLLSSNNKSKRYRLRYPSKYI